MKAILSLYCLKEHWAGNDEAVKNKPFNNQVLSWITGSLCLRKGWKGDDWAVKDKLIDSKLLYNVFYMMYHGEGLPTEVEVKAEVTAYRQCSSKTSERV